METLRKILRYVIFGILLLLMAVMALLQLSSVQTKLAGIAVEKLENAFDAKVSLGEFHFKPVNTIVIKDLTLIDPSPINSQANDTLAHIGCLSSRFSIWGFIAPGQNGIRLKNVRLHDSKYYLVVEHGKYKTNMHRLFHIGDRKKREKSDKDILFIKDITVDNFAFKLLIVGSKKEFPQPTAIKWNDLDVRNVNLRANDFRISGGVFSGIPCKMSFEEWRSGWRVEDLHAGFVTAGKGEVDIREMYLADAENSVAELDLKLTGRTSDYRNYIHKVVMDADIKNSSWSFHTLSRFIPKLNPDPETTASLDGHFSGTVDAMKASPLNMKVNGSTVQATLDGTVTGLPSISGMEVDAQLSNTRFTTGDLTALIRSIAPKAKMDISRFGTKETYTLKARAKGNLSGMDATASLYQGWTDGSIDIKAKVNNIHKNRKSALSASGAFSASNFELGKFLDASKLGGVSADSFFKVSLPYGGENLSAELDSLKIHEFAFNGHTYTGVGGNISLLDRDITAELQTTDPAFDTDISIWSDKYAYNCAVLVHNADLATLNLDKRDTSKTSFNMYGHIDKDLDNLQGNASFSRIFLTNSKGTYDIENVSVSAEKENREYDITLDSDFAQATFHGNRSHCKAELISADTTPVLDYLFPGTYLEKGSRVKVDIDSTGMLNGTIRSGRVAYHDNFIRNLEAGVKGTVKNPEALITAENISAYGFVMDRDTIRAAKTDSLISASFIFDNRDNEEFRRADISADMILHSDRSKDLRLFESHLDINRQNWHIHPCHASIQGKNANIDSLFINHGNKWIFVDGNTSERDSTRMRAIINDFDLSALNHIFPNRPLGMGGKMDLDACLISPIGHGMPGLEMNMGIDSLIIGNAVLGDFDAISTFDKESGNFTINADNRISGNNNMTANAVYHPGSGNMDALVSLEKLPIGFAQVLLPTVFSRMDGSVSGNFHFDGPFKNLEFRSTDARLDNALLEIAFTNVPYIINGPFSIDNSGIHMDDLKVADRFGHEGKAHGGISWKRGRQMRMALDLDVHNMEAVNIPADQIRKVFYGSIFGTGKVKISGPLRNMLLDADVRTTGNSNLFIAFSDRANATKGELLTFTKAEEKEADPYDAILEKYKVRNVNKASRGFRMKMHAVADPTLLVVMNLGVGKFATMIKGHGNGAVDMDINPQTTGFVMLGDYILDDGSIDVNTSNIVHRDFKIASGSSIKFAKNIWDSTLDLDATYEAKASIEALLADKSSVSNRRTVLCGINIRDRLSNPTVKFSIDVPDLEASVKSRVEGALNTEDKIQKQFLSLLLSNNFLPDEQGGIVNNTSILYSNVSEMMANQINNVFTKLDIPLDLGLNYQQTDMGTNLFDVALSTQLWNNRIIIGGTLGNKQNNYSRSTTLFGDFDIEMKVNRTGTFRVKAFSHSADQYSIYLDNAQRNGFGLTWQQEFDTFPEWFKRLFSSKATREALQALDAMQAQNIKTLKLTD